MVGGNCPFLAERGTVTEGCKDKRKVKILNQADIIITATGKEGIIPKIWLKRGLCKDVGYLTRTKVM